MRTSSRCIDGDTKGPLFRTAPRTNVGLTRNPMRTADVWRMTRRRIKQTGIDSGWLPQLPGDGDHLLP